MNKLYKIIFGFSLVILLNSCTETIDSVDLPYTEKLVVRAILEAGKPINNISIIKTLPALDSFDINKAAITNADAFILVDNQSYKLVHLGSGIYSAENLTAESGKKYEFKLNWNGKSCSATTTVPYPIEILEITKLAPVKNKRKNDWTVGLSGKIKIPAGVAVVGGFQYVDSLGIKETINRYTAKVFREQDSSSKGFLRITMFSAQVTDTNNVIYDYDTYKLYNTIESYDIQFYDYFKTRSNGETIASTFGFTSSDVTWNIKGDGLGLFLGVAKTKKRYIQ